jgi:hypothetical protein
MTRRSRKMSAFILIVTFACVALFARPRPYLTSGLGADWRCSKTAWIFTTCTWNHVPRNTLAPSQPVVL